MDVVYIDKQKMLLKVNIAGLCLQVDSYFDMFLYNSLSDYRTDKDETDYVININMTENEIEASKGKKLTQRNDNNWYLTENGQYEYILFDPDLKCITIKITYNISENKINILLLNIDKLYNINMRSFAFNTLGMAFSFFILWENGFTVHASSIAYNNTGLAFSAVSGTGKSTHTSLWVKNFSNTYILNDDNPALRFVDGKWYLYGTPWAGTTGMNKNIVVPLKALIFLERGETNSIRDCSAMEAIYRFFEAVFHPISDEVTTLILNLLNLLLVNSHICVLKCNMSDEAPKVVRNFLFNN